MAPSRRRGVPQATANIHGFVSSGLEQRLASRLMRARDTHCACAPMGRVVSFGPIRSTPICHAGLEQRGGGFGRQSIACFEKRPAARCLESVLHNTCGQITIPPAATNVIAISAGGRHSLALKGGRHGRGIRGSGNDSGQSPECRAGLSERPGGDLRRRRRWSAYSSHGLALKRDGTIVAWGRPNYIHAAIRR